MAQKSIRYDIKNGSQVRTIDILDEEADVQVTDDKGNTLLHIAFKTEEPNQDRIIQVFKILLKRGLDINAKNVIGRTVLHFAIQRRYRDVIDFCMRKKADLNVTESNGNTLAHFIIEEECLLFHLIIRSQNLEELENKNSSFVDWMVSKEFDFFYRRNKKNQSALYLAIELNLQHILCTLLKHITDFSLIEKDQTSILCDFLCKNADLRRLPTKNYYTKEPIDTVYYRNRHIYNILKNILENNQSMSNATLNLALRIAIKNDESFDVIDLIINHIPSAKRNRFNEESLIQFFTIHYHIFSSEQRIEYGMRILKKLVDKGADVNEPDDNGETIALKWFRDHPKLEMLRLLQNCRADITRKTKDDENYLHLICRYSNEIGMVKIVAVGCDVTIPNSRGESPLEIAILHRNVMIAMDLLDFDVNFNDMSDGSSLLSLACQMGQTEVVEKMIKIGANLKYIDNSGRSLLHISVDNESIVELLLKNGVDVNAGDTMGRTPLHLAYRVSLIETLVNAGALVDLPDHEGHTPLSNMMYQSSKVTAELLKRGANILQPQVFQQVLAYFQSSRAIERNTSRYVMKHLVKMSAIGLLYKISHSDKSSEQRLQVFFKKCQEEVKLLQEFFVDDCTSLYQLLHRNQNRRCAYTDNEKLKNLVEDDAIDEKFPNYFVLIIGCYSEAKTRRPLMQEAICVLRKMIEVSLPDLCIDEILMYLSNMDLAHFIEAGKIL